jgi:hypothetical protein
VGALRAVFSSCSLCTMYVCMYVCMYYYCCQEGLRAHWGAGRTLRERKCFNFSSGCLASPSSALSSVTPMVSYVAHSDISRTTMRWFWWNSWQQVRIQKWCSDPALVLLAHNLGSGLRKGATGRAGGLTSPSPACPPQPAGRRPCKAKVQYPLLASSRQTSRNDGS